MREISQPESSFPSCLMNNLGKRPTEHTVLPGPGKQNIVTTTKQKPPPPAMEYWDNLNMKVIWSIMTFKETETIGNSCFTGRRAAYRQSMTTSLLTTSDRSDLIFS